MCLSGYRCGWLLPLPSVSLISAVTVPVACQLWARGRALSALWNSCFDRFCSSVRIQWFRGPCTVSQRNGCVLVMWQLHLFVLCKVYRWIIYSSVCWLKDWAWLLSNFFWINVPYCSSLFSEKCLSGEWSKVWNSLISHRLLIFYFYACILILESVIIMMPLSVCLITTQ